jgi:hypothetical protein
MSEQDVDGQVPVAMNGVKPVWRPESSMGTLRWFQSQLTL